MTTPPTIVHIPKSKKALGHARTSIAHASSPPSTGAFPVVQPSAGHGQQQGNAASLHKMQHQQHQHQHRPSDASHDPAITGDAAFLVSDSLYFEVPQAITDHDIFTLLMPCQPISIQRNKQNKDAMATGWIRFLNKESADRAYTLFDGLVFKHSHRLQLYMTPNGIKDPLPEGPIFQVENIPYWVTNEHLYQLFRPFGAIRLCKILVEKNGAFEGTALLQYFSLKHANHAKASMNQRSLDGNMPLKIFALVSTKAPNQLKQQQVGKPDTMIDYTNLYIKNLDLAVKSLDLFSAFREYGRIISARVMKDPVTKQSRGYGFVSFSHAQEAKQALEQLNGQYILSKQVVIAYHEPKKKKQGSGTGHEATSSPSSSPSPGLEVVHDASPSAVKEMASPGNLDAYTEVTASMESTSQRQLQFDRVRTAIVKALKGVGEEPASLTQLAEWVEVIMALRPTSRALCLFNPSYLLTKLEEAASNSSSSSPKPRTPNLVYSSTPPLQHTRDWIPQQPPVTSSVSTTTIHPSLSTTTTTATIAAITGSCTGAAARNTHITASNSSSVTTASSGIKTDIIHMHDTDTQVTIDRFVQSIKNLSILQQKQHLGDMLFPHVKATGVKHAPKVTIQLLDTQPLDQLAHAMRSMESLKPLVDRAFNQITMQQKFRNAIMQI